MFATKYVASNHCYGRSNNYSSDQFTSFNQLMKGILLIAGSGVSAFCFLAPKAMFGSLFQSTNPWSSGKCVRFGAGRPLICNPFSVNMLLYSGMSLTISICNSDKYL